MTINFPKGKNLILDNPQDAIDFLHSLNSVQIEIEPERLRINNYNNVLFLQIYSDHIYEVPIRESFFQKLLRWYGFPLRQLKFLDIETITSICNDYLLNIKSKKVIVKLENNEALTITSEKFSEVNDIELIEKTISAGIEKIIIDDFSTNIMIEEKCQIKPFPNDVFGYGLAIKNSETGFSSVAFNDFLFRYICSNGAYIKENGFESKFYHYNLFVPDVYARLNESLSTINIRAKQIEMKLKMMEEPIKKFEMFSINKAIFKHTAFKLLDDLIDSDRTLTKYELMNIITERAKTFPFNLRSKIETIAGSLLR